jgi:chromosome segregation ATPase
MAWLRQSHEIKQDIRHVEERLAEIAESQSELSRNSQEIKDLTAKIVKTLNAGVSNDLLVRLISDIESIPSLLQEMTPTIKSVEAQFADLHQSQLKIQNDVLHVISLITDLIAQSQRGS